ncbi:hypothetical protein [Caldiplasma sukawensis]
MSYFKKERVYEGNYDVNDATEKLKNMLINMDWKVQSNSDGKKGIVQAYKVGILRGLIAADRSLTFVLENDGNSLIVNCGVSRWIGNMAITAIETIFISEIFLAVDIPEMAWNQHVERDILDKFETVLINQ